MTADEPGTPCHQNSFCHGIGLCCRATSPNLRPTTCGALSTAAHATRSPHLQSVIDSFGLDTSAANGSTITARASSSKDVTRIDISETEVRRGRGALGFGMKFSGASMNFQHLFSLR